MPDVARVRIGRVTLKGGARLVLYQRPEKTRIVELIQEWASGVSRLDPPPEAFAAIAFFPEGDGRPTFSSSMDTQTDVIPLVLLPDIVRAYLSRELMAAGGRQDALESLGYQVDD